MGPDAMILVFWMLSFKPTFSLSSFTLIKRLFSYSSLSAIRAVLFAYLRLLIFLPAILIPVCASSNPAFLMMYSVYKLNKHFRAGTKGAESLDGVSHFKELEPRQPSCAFLVAHSRLILWDFMDCSSPGSSVHGISQQEYWRGLPFPPPGDFPQLRIKPTSPEPPALQADSLPLSHRGSPGSQAVPKRFSGKGIRPKNYNPISFFWNKCL